MGCGASAQKYVHDEDKVIVEGAGVKACNGVFKRRGMVDGKPNFRKIDGSGERIWFCSPEAGPYGEFGTWFLGNPGKTNGKATYYVRCRDVEQLHPPLADWKPWIYGTAQRAPGRMPSLKGDAIERAACEATIRRNSKTQLVDRKQHSSPVSAAGAADDSDASTASTPLPPAGASSALAPLPIPRKADSSSSSTPQTPAAPALSEGSANSFGEDAVVYPDSGDGRTDATPESKISPTMLVETTPQSRSRSRLLWPGDSPLAAPRSHSQKLARKTKEERIWFRNKTAPFSPASADGPFKALACSPETLTLDATPESVAP